MCTQRCRLCVNISLSGPLKRCFSASWEDEALISLSNLWSVQRPMEREAGNALGRSLLWLTGLVLHFPAVQPCNPVVVFRSLLLESLLSHILKPRRRVDFNKTWDENHFFELFSIWTILMFRWNISYYKHSYYVVRSASSEVTYCLVPLSVHLNCEIPRKQHRTAGGREAMRKYKVLVNTCWQHFTWVSKFVPIVSERNESHMSSDAQARTRERIQAIFIQCDVVKYV